MKSGSSIDIKEQKKIEEELRLLSQYDQDAIIQMNSDGLVIYWNKSAENLFGYTEKEMLGKNLHSIIVPERYHKAYKIGFSKFIKSGQGAAINKTLEIEGIRKDGAEFPIELSLSAVRVKGEGNVIGIIRDITSRKITEKQLKESEKKYKILSKELELILDNIPALLFYKDDRNNLIRINKYFANAHKTTKEALAGKNCFDIYPKDVAQKYFDDDLEVIKSKKPKLNFLEPWDVAEGRRWVNSNKIPLYDDGKCIGIIGFSTDVTEQVKAEQKLIESEEKYRTILDSIKEGYFEVDLYGNFIFINNALCELFGYSKKELLSMNYETLCDDENKRLIFRTYNNLYKEGKGSVLFDFVQIKKNGERIFEESSVYLKFNSQSEIIGFKGLIRDITERKKTEILRRKFQQELEKEVQYRTKELNDALEKQKLYLDQIIKSSRFKNEFLATMSHELRTPLNAIIGFTDLLLEGVFGKLNEEQLEYIKDIDESSNHLLDMITNILDISRIEAGQTTLTVEEIHLNDLVNQVISTLRSLYNEKGLIIDLKGLKKEQLIFADRIKFKQIIYNLLSNAIKFTEKGKVTFEFRDSKDMWEFIVKDTGIGIAEKDFNIIFKEFKRVKSAYIDSIPGSGLGLALTKRIVNLHGGDILFTSKLGKGTTFTFTIPKNLRKKVNGEKKVGYFLSKL